MSSVKEMYDELLYWYKRWTLTGAYALEKDIRKLMSKGLSREEAIAKLYEEKVGWLKAKEREAERELVTDLEASLRKFRESGGGDIGLLVFLIALLFMPLFFVAPFAVFFLFFLLAILSAASSAWSASATASWSFRETLRIENAGEFKEEVMSKVPGILQELLLEEVKSQKEDDTLRLVLELGASVPEVEGNRTVEPRYVKLGTFVIVAKYSVDGDDLIIDVSYSSSAPQKYVAVASELYEKVVVAFRVANNKAVEQAKPKVVIEFDFAELLEKLSKVGIVVSEVKCPRCGAPVKIPKTGTITKCEYCGAVLKAVDVYEIIKESLKELKKLAS